MAAHSTMLPLGTIAPSFSLPEPGTGKVVSLKDFDGAQALLVMFICNHCPYVKYLRSAIAAYTRDLQMRGVASVGISSTDVVNFPADTPEKMVEEKHVAGYAFPYLYDEAQDVAKAYQAACTPEFYLFNRDRKLVYRGRFDESSPKNGKPVTGSDLKAAVDALLSQQAISSEQFPSIGCSIKWKPGNEPGYFSGG